MAVCSSCSSPQIFEITVFQQQQDSDWEELLLNQPYALAGSGMYVGEDVLKKEKGLPRLSRSTTSAESFFCYGSKNRLVYVSNGIEESKLIEA